MHWFSDSAGHLAFSSRKVSVEHAETVPSEVISRNVDFKSPSANFDKTLRAKVPSEVREKFVRLVNPVVRLSTGHEFQFKNFQIYAA